MGERKPFWSKIEKFKYPALVLVIGLVLLLLPGGSEKAAETGDRDEQLREVLTQTEGVGQAQVLISDSGVIVVCQGAEDPRVRLDIIRAVGSYTGFGSDKITILKMAD